MLVYDTRCLYVFSGAGEFHSTEYTEEGIIVPKVFYNSLETKDKEASKDDFSEDKVDKKGDSKEMFVLDIETLSSDLSGLEILKETGHKIVSEDILQPAEVGVNPFKVVKMVQRKLSRNPITDNPEQPLEARYKPSVPVVQVNVNFVRATTTLQRLSSRCGREHIVRDNLRESFILLDLLTTKATWNRNTNMTDFDHCSALDSFGFQN